ncbi:CARDB domain-containing protein [Anaerolineales bacterium HSG25]|nr:CARDB domain-containing protein [Anaerolineales bacterium HSG25]
MKSAKFILPLVLAITLLASWLVILAQAQEPLPDLAIDSLVVSHTAPTVSDTITITVQARNIGSVGVSGYRVYLYYTDSTEQPPQSSTKADEEFIIVDSWPAGAAMLGEVSLTLDQVGDKAIYAWVDPLERIAETEEQNNLKRLDFTVTQWGFLGDRHEPNNDCPEAIEITPNGDPSFFSFTENDVDWVKFPVTQGQVYDIRTLSLGQFARPRFVIWSNCQGPPQDFGDTFRIRYPATTNGFAYLPLKNKLSSTFEAGLTAENTAYQLTVQIQSAPNDNPVGPQIKDITPTQSDNLTDTDVVITGESFTLQSEMELCTPQNNSCTANCVPLVWQKASFEGENKDGDKRLEATIPPNLPPGNYCLTVTNPNNQTDTLEQAFTVTAGSPILTSVAPAYGYNDVPTSLSLYGQRLFTQTVSLKLGENSLTEISTSFDDGTELQVTVPANLSPGTYPLTVRYENGQETTLANAYTVLSRGDDLSASPQNLLVIPTAPQLNKTAQLSLMVQRVGGQTPLQNIPVRFSVEGQSIGTAYLTSLAGNSQASTSALTWTPTRTGDHVIMAEIDPDHQFEESSTANNLINTTLTVIPARQDTVPPNIEGLVVDKGESSSTPFVRLAINANDTPPGQVAALQYQEFVFNQGAKQWRSVGDTGWVVNNSSNANYYAYQLSPVGGVHYIQAWVQDNSGNVSQIPYQQRIEYHPTINQLSQTQIHFYRRVLQAGQNLAVTLSPTLGDPDLYVWSENWTKGQPTGISNMAQSDDTVCITAQEAGVYQIEVYGYSEALYGLEIVTDGSCRTSRQIDSNKTQNQSPLVDPTNLPLDETAFGDKQSAAYLPALVKQPPPTPVPTPTPNPSIQVKMNITPDEITYNGYLVVDYSITNNGNVDLTDIQLSDNLIGQVTSLDSLSAGQTETVRKEYRITLNDKQDLTNQAIITGKYGNSTITDQSDTDSVTIQLTALSIESQNTGGITPFELRLASDPNILVLSCNIDNNVTTYCGTVHSHVEYKIVAYTKRCGKIEGNRTYTQVEWSQNIFCN